MDGLRDSLNDAFQGLSGVGQLGVLVVLVAFSVGGALLLKGWAKVAWIAGWAVFVLWYADMSPLAMFNEVMMARGGSR